MNKENHEDRKNTKNGKGLSPFVTFVRFFSFGWTGIQRTDPGRTAGVRWESSVERGQNPESNALSKASPAVPAG